MKPEPTRRKAVLNRTDTDNSGLIQQRTWKVRNLASPLVYDWILCFGTAILFQKPLCKYHVSHCWYGNNPTNEKCRNPWKIKASGTSWSRGWENRTLVETLSLPVNTAFFQSPFDYIWLHIDYINRKEIHSAWYHKTNLYILMYLPIFPKIYFIFFCEKVNYNLFNYIFHHNFY